MSAAVVITPTAEHPSPIEEKPVVTSRSDSELDVQAPRKRKLGELGPVASERRDGPCLGISLTPTPQ
jgi:hypothetical protein